MRELLDAIDGRKDKRALATVLGLDAAVVERLLDALEALGCIEPRTSPQTGVVPKLPQGRSRRAATGKSVEPKTAARLRELSRRASADALPHEVSIWVLRARTAQAVGDLGAALGALNVALSMAPDSPQIRGELDQVRRLCQAPGGRPRASRSGT